MLDRDGALHLNDAGEYGPWPDPGPGEDVHLIDFDALASGGFSQEEQLGIALDDTIAHRVLGGTGALRRRDNAVPPLDVLAWYQPMHFFANNWGIFIRESALVDLARDLAPRFQPFLDRRPVDEHVAVILRAAFAFLFLHEQYHHEIESVAIRLHIIEQRPVYPDFVRIVTSAVRDTDDDLQEALANADAWTRLGQAPYSAWFRADERRVIRDWMEDIFAMSPPGYNRAGDYLQEQRFLIGESVLLAQVQEAKLMPSRPFAADFGTATHLTRALFNLRQHVWTLVPTGQQPILSTLPGVFPLATG